MHEITLIILVLGLFLPRISLLIAYCSGVIPPNPIPFWGDFFMALFIPRVLILVYIILNLGVCGWFWLHLVFLILVFANGVARSSHSASKRS